MIVFLGNLDPQIILQHKLVIFFRTSQFHLQCKNEKPQLAPTNQRKATQLSYLRGLTAIIGDQMSVLSSLTNRGCSSTRVLDYSTRSKSNFQYSMMLVLDFYKSGNARPDSILELEAHEYPKHEINKKSMEISTKILKSTYKICKNEAKIKKKSYIFTFRQSHNSI